MWCSEFRFSGVRRDHGWGVANANFRVMCSSTVGGLYESSFGSVPAYTFGATSGGLLLAPGCVWVSVTARMRVGIVRWECSGVRASRRLIWPRNIMMWFGVEMSCFGIEVLCFGVGML